MTDNMRKFLSMTIVLFALFSLAACDGNSDTAVPLTTQTVTQNGTNQANIISEQPPEQPHEWTIEELGATIVAAGEFWNKWWASHHTFEWEYIDDSRRNWNPWDEAITPAHHPLSRGFAIVLPSSGFESLDDIGAYLSQFYTQAWIDRGFFAEPEVLIEIQAGEYATIFGFAGFEEYEGYLFIFVQSEMSARPDWQTATHTLIEQSGNRAVVETVVTTSINGFEGGGIMPTITYRFTLIDGRIESGFGQWEQYQDSLAQ